MALCTRWWLRRSAVLLLALAPKCEARAGRTHAPAHVPPSLLHAVAKLLHAEAKQHEACW